MSEYQTGSIVGTVANDTRTINGRLSGVMQLRGAIKSSVMLRGTIMMPQHVGGELYTGSCTIVPSDTEQVLPTAGKALLDNITVEAIPSNYGRITFNGTTLTVS